MRHGLYLPPIGTFGDPHTLVEVAQAAEAAGWDGMFLWDHLQYEVPVPLADTWMTLAAIATATSTLRLGPLITPLARRRPWKVAREAVTLDQLSYGRLVLGVGLGIDYWGEFNCFRGEASDDVERAQLVDDGIEIITRLWSGDQTTFQGQRLGVDGAQFVPAPVQQPRIPIWSAALWPPSRHGPLARAARVDGIMPFTGAPMTPHDAAQVVAQMAAARTTDAPFDVALWGDRTASAEFEAAGVTWLLEAAMPELPLEEFRRIVDAGPPGAR